MNSSAEIGPVMRPLVCPTAPSCSLECCASCLQAFVVVAEELVALEEQEVPWETQVSTRRVTTRLLTSLSLTASNLISLVEYYAILCPELIHPPIQLGDQASLWALILTVIAFPIWLHFAELCSIGAPSALMPQWHQK